MLFAGYIRGVTILNWGEFSSATGKKLVMLEYVSLLEPSFLLTHDSILVSEITYNLFFHI